MSKKEKRKAPIPLSGAGLIRFFEEDIHGIKIKPAYVVMASIMLILTVILAHLLTGI